MGEVINLDIPTLGDIPADKVLNGALAAGLKQVIIIGETADGTVYHASSTGDTAEVIYAVEVFKHQLMRLADE